MPHDDDAPTQPGDHPGTQGLRLLVVPGVNPAKWLRVWTERLPDVPAVLVHARPDEAVDLLRAGTADAALLRLPVDRADLSAIPLYTETTVVMVPADHLLTAVDEVTPADLAEEVLLVPDDDVVPWPDRPGEPVATDAPATTAAAVELVAAGVGVLVVPQSLARLHHRKDLTYRPVADAPTSTVGLAWLTDRESELVEELIGIVRGRTVNSSRGRAAAPGAPAEAADAPRGAARAARPGSDGSAGSARTGGRPGGRGSGARAAGGRTSGGRSSGGRAGGGKGGKSRGSGPGQGKGRRPR